MSSPGRFLHAPFVLVEVGTDGVLPEPVITKSQDITNVCIDWSSPMSPAFLTDAIRVLREYQHEHPRIALALERLEAMQP